LRELQANHAEIQETNTINLSISAVSQATAERLVDVFELDYPVLSDIDTQTIQEYGVLNTSGTNAIISIFIIDVKGIIRWKQILGDQVVKGAQVIQELDKINQE